MSTHDANKNFEKCTKNGFGGNKNFHNVWCIVSLVRCIFGAYLVNCNFGALHLWCIFGKLFLLLDAYLVLCIFGEVILWGTASLVHYIFGGMHLVYGESLV